MFAYGIIGCNSKNYDTKNCKW